MHNILQIDSKVVWLSWTISIYKLIGFQVTKEVYTYVIKFLLKGLKETGYLVK